MTAETPPQRTIYYCNLCAGTRVVIPGPLTLCPYCDGPTLRAYIDGTRPPQRHDRES